MAARGAPRSTGRGPAYTLFRGPYGLYGLRSILRGRRSCVAAWGAPVLWAFSGDKFLELVERADPSAFVAIACGLVEQLFVVQGEKRAVTVRLKRHRDQRFTLRRRMPGPAENKFPVRHHVAIDAADLVMSAVRHIE